jgi:hypothetical protein
MESRSIHLFIVLACACGTREKEPSQLEQRARAQVEAGQEAATDAPNAGTSTTSAESPPPDSERVQLALALEEPTTYRVQTIGSVKLPMVLNPTGFALEERVRLHDCEGEGTARKCRIEHRYSNFEAEPPAGRFLQADYDRVHAVVTEHVLTASGFREGDTKINEAPDALDAELRSALAGVHCFFCLRFPTEPVGVGAKWNNTCNAYLRGTVATREVMWELSELTDDPNGFGRRAELTAVGKYLESGKEGSVQSTLFFYVDLGQPHILRERISISLGEKGLKTVTNLTYAFGKVLPGKPEKVVQVTGLPFDKDALSGAVAPTQTDPGK